MIYKLIICWLFSECFLVKIIYGSKLNVVNNEASDVCEPDRICEQSPKIWSNLLEEWTLK